MWNPPILVQHAHQDYIKYYTGICSIYIFVTKFLPVEFEGTLYNSVVWIFGGQSTIPSLYFFLPFWLPEAKYQWWLILQWLFEMFTKKVLKTDWDFIAMCNNLHHSMHFIDIWNHIIFWFYKLNMLCHIVFLFCFGLHFIIAMDKRIINGKLVTDFGRFFFWKVSLDT